MPLSAGVIPFVRRCHPFCSQMPCRCIARSARLVKEHRRMFRSTNGDNSDYADSIKNTVTRNAGDRNLVARNTTDDRNLVAQNLGRPKPKTLNTVTTKLLELESLVTPR